ncbi:MAG: hypothetical protein NTW74_21050 [Acidobacteria bacterium]|nr:hypothetical protein [Acidobacteriota bacterium]
MSMPVRNLADLHGIGKSMLKDFELLGVKGVSDLARRDGDRLYRTLEKKTGSRQDPCVLDVFRCAVAQARDAQLPRDQCNWWWWSRERLAGRLAPARPKAGIR